MLGRSRTVLSEDHEIFRRSVRRFVETELVPHNPAWEDAGKPKLPAPPGDVHDALADARHNLERWLAIEAHRERQNNSRKHL